MSFISRFQSWPGTDTLSLIEGVAIIDLPAPGSLQGVNTGIAALIGEFADCSAILSASSLGVITAKYAPLDIRGSQMLFSLLGGCDETIGNFGSQCGNGFVELRNKVFAGGRLVIVPINIASNRGCRFFRQLPVNRSNSAAIPAVPMQPGTVLAGREFIDGSGYKLRITKTLNFAATAAYASGINGSMTNGAAAATQTFTRAAGSFITDGVAAGDILVIGAVITPAAGVTTAGGGTYRVVSRDSATVLTVERLDGENFAFATLSSRAWRIHASNCADTGGAYAIDAVAAYTTPVRPLTHSIAAAEGLTPTLVPTAMTATVWDTLSGLGGISHYTDTVPYTADIQAVNASIGSSSSALLTEYQAAFDCLLSESSPANLPTLLWSARKYADISAMGQAHVIAAAAAGHGRTWFASPRLDQISNVTDVATNSVDGVAVYPSRNERRVYPWPHVTTLVPELKGVSIAGADANNYSDGVVDVGFDGWEVAVATNLPPERSIGEEIAPATTVLAPCIGIGRNIDTLAKDDYIALKQLGVSTAFQDQIAGMVVQSAITTSLTTGETQINRRRMADYVEESLAQLLRPYSKRLLTESLKDVILAVVSGFLDGLKNPANPDDARIQDYAVDGQSLNTAELANAGIFGIDVRVEMLATSDVLALQCSVGKGVLTITAGV